MYKITREQFLLRQPSFPEVSPSDPFYYDLTCRLLSRLLESKVLDVYPDAIVGRAALCVVGYLQDVVADCGVWRSFVNECRRLYGRTLPFYEVGEEYVDYELNREDVRFILWYSLSMYYEPLRVADPLDVRFDNAADVCMGLLSEAYEESPVPDGYVRWRHVELGVPEEQNEVLDLAQWLFMHCYLMTPAFAFSLSQIVEEVGMDKEGDSTLILQQRLEEAMRQEPTGPLSLYIGEWLHLILSGKPLTEPSSDTTSENRPPHKFYTAFTKATGGKEIAFIPTYDELNRFFIDSLGWEKGEEHLPQMKGDRDFIILVNREKGMLVARNVARCVASPDNPLYDKKYAASHAISLLTERGVCPADLLHYICSHGWLPDAVLPGSSDHDLVASNYDFIARCYLQQYYRGD